MVFSTSSPKTEITRFDGHARVALVAGTGTTHVLVLHFLSLSWLKQVVPLKREDMEEVRKTCEEVFDSEARGDTMLSLAEEVGNYSLLEESSREEHDFHEAFHYLHVIAAGEDEEKLFLL